MKNNMAAALAVFFAASTNAQTQAPETHQRADGQWEINVERTIPVEFMGVVRPFVEWDSTQRFRDERVRDRRGLIGENEEAEEAMEGRRGHPAVDPNALPHGVDPALQIAAPIHGFDRAVDISVNGMGNTGVSPADPCMSVGSTHVIQMINGSSGGYFRIYDKNLANPGAQTYLDNFTASVAGAGDPIVVYDALADRWLMSEFSSSGNRLLVAISQTANPTGAWYAYSYQATNFPDYPKYAVWNNCYVVTTNENTPAIYALPRANMLAGTSGTAVRFVINTLQSIGFQSATPVHFGGGTAPPAGAPAMFMRMVDDLWTTVADVDRLELWNINYNAATPGSSTITGPTALPTDAFDSALCGYTTLNCIQQPGTQTMDPLREVLMNRICYRNLSSFGYEAIGCTHAVDVNATDRAAMRWYELHRTVGIANAWAVQQQGTYSPDANDRWMGSIAINNNGDVGLSYNIAGTTGGNVYPGIRYTGRYKDDPLGQMTFAETSIVAGTASNGDNRYGDYGSLDVDPSDGTSFYGTAMYNPASAWSTRMFKFSFTPLNINVSPKAFLEGPYVQAGGMMHDSLRVRGLIPLAQPFTSLGYVHVGGGGEVTTAPVLAVSGTNAIVDWVLVELRNSTTPSTVVASKSALVQRDGDVVGTDGVSPVSFTIAAGNYFVAVRHRNHLGAMTATAQALTNVPLSLNFTTLALSTYGANALKDVSGTQVLWTGDVTFNKTLIYVGSGNDRDPILTRVGGTTPNNVVSGYYAEDTNMDGNVSYIGTGNDRDVILINVGSTTPNNSRAEQIP